MTPTEVWDYAHKCWVAFNPKHEPVFDGWATEAGVDRIEELKFNNPAAKHYLYYDIGPWVQPRAATISS